MNIYSTKFINLVSLMLTIIIFSFVNFSINKLRKNQNYLTNEIDSYEENEIEDNSINEILNTEILEEEKEENYNWYIEIKAIDLLAPIEETTNMEILNNNIGHFEETGLTTGNIGLAGHNRGYNKNYFARLKDVKIGDEVTYKYNDFLKTYVVDRIEIIRNTDWSFLENTEQNMITMITCTENEPEYRLCVQATEKE